MQVFFPKTPEKSPEKAVLFSPGRQAGIVIRRCCIYHIAVHIVTLCKAQASGYDLPYMLFAVRRVECPVRRYYFCLDIFFQGFVHSHFF